jgi:hypothetical protein
LTAALSGPMNTNLELLKSGVEGFEKAGLPGDLRERMTAMKNALQKLLELKGTAQTSSSITEDVTQKIKDVSAFIDSIYDLVSRAEVLSSMGSRLIALIKSAEVRQLQGKLLIFVRLDPSIFNEPSLAGKVDKMVALVAQVEQLND